MAKTRTRTGERDLFIELYIQCGGRSKISGIQLLPPDNEFFHWQFSHVLPKGLYQRFRLYEKNIIPMLRKEHVYVTEHEGEARKDERWKWYFELKEILKQEYFNGKDI